jgi:hypothetical protein
MTWILVLWLMSGAVTVAEYETRDKCMIALDEIRVYTRQATPLCVPVVVEGRVR